MRRRSVDFRRLHGITDTSVSIVSTSPSQPCPLAASNFDFEKTLRVPTSSRPAGKPAAAGRRLLARSLARSLRMISTSPNKDLIWVAFPSARRLPRGGSDRRVREPSRKRKVSHCNLCPRMRSPTHLTRAQPTYSHTRRHQAATKNAVNVALFAEINTSRCLRMKTCYPGRFSI